MKSCSKCGTLFQEVIGNQTINSPIDNIPECYHGNKENGVCIECCTHLHSMGNEK